MTLELKQSSGRRTNQSQIKTETRATKGRRTKIFTHKENAAKIIILLVQLKTSNTSKNFMN